MQIVRFDLNAKIPWHVGRGESGCWVAICDPLSLTVEAESFGQLHGAISFAIDDLFRYLLGRSELDAFLRGHGWMPVGGPIPTEEPIEGVSFDLPYDVLFDAESASA